MRDRRVVSPRLLRGATLCAGAAVLAVVTGIQVFSIFESLRARQGLETQMQRLHAREAQLSEERAERHNIVRLLSDTDAITDDLLEEIARAHFKMSERNDVLVIYPPEQEATEQQP